MPDQDQTVGVIGLGLIGAGAVRNLARQKFDVSGYDVREDAAAALDGLLTRADSPAAVARRSDIVLVAVLNDEQVRDVLAGPNGITSVVGRTKIVVILSTTSLATIRWASEVCAPTGIAVLDCGVSGGRGGFEARKVTAMVGGDAAAFHAANPILTTFADPVLHMGDTGRGMAAKLARNVLVYTDWSVAWEAARLIQAAGVDLEAFVRAVDASDHYIDGHTALIAVGVGLGDGTPESRARGAGVAPYARKDLLAALELSKELEVAMPAARLALDRLAEFMGLESDSDA